MGCEKKIDCDRLGLAEYGMSYAAMREHHDRYLQLWDW